MFVQIRDTVEAL